MGEWVGTDSLELTKQGSFPLVFGVLPILHLLEFFAAGQILIQKSITLFSISVGGWLD